MTTKLRWVWMLGVTGLLLMATARADELAELDRLHRMAREHPEQALTALKALPSSETLLRRRVQALALVYGGQTDAALALFTGEAASSPTGLLVRGMVARRAGQHGDALTLAERALKGMPDCPARPACDRPLAYELEWLRAVSHHGLGAFGQAVKAQSAALVLAQQMADPHRQARSLMALVVDHRQREEPELARQKLQDAMALTGLDGGTQAQLQVIAGALARDAKNQPAQLEALGRALQLAEQHGALLVAMTARVNLADYWLQQGQPQRARELAMQVLGTPMAAREPALARAVQANLVLSLIQLREFATARAQAADLEAQHRQAPARDRLMLLRELAAAWAQAGQWSDALRVLHAERKLATDVRAKELAQVLDDQRKDQAAARQRLELALLEEKQALHQRTLDNQRVLRWIGILAGLLVGLGLLVAVFFWVSSRSANQRLRHSQEKLKGLTDHDALTGLLNRRSIQDTMAAREAENSGQGGWLLMDIDFFKRINDQHGHAVGDQVLRAVAQRLSTLVRGGEFLARWGGEEFLIHAPQASAAEMRQLAHRLLRALAAQPVALEDGNTLPVSASMGFVVFPLPPDHPAFGWERAVNWADLALYTAKNAGRACGVGIVEARLPDGTALEQIEADFEGAVNAARVKLIEVRASDP